MPAQQKSQLPAVGALGICPGSRVCESAEVNSPVPGWGAPGICRGDGTASPTQESRAPRTAEKPIAGSGVCKPRLSGVWKQRSEQPRFRTGYAGNLPESWLHQPHAGKPGALHSRNPAAGSGRHAIQGTSPPKAERTGRPPVLSYYYALGRKPRKAWKAEGSATSPARAAASAQRQPSGSSRASESRHSSPSICHST